MGSHMKTTIEISDPLLKEARRLAERENTTLRSLVETGLRAVLADKKRGRQFVLRKASFKGKGLQPALKTADWDTLRELAYEGRGA
jgi:Bacterial antitoxin of type II TA system, VapB